MAFHMLDAAAGLALLVFVVLLTFARAHLLLALKSLGELSGQAKLFVIAPFAVIAPNAGSNLIPVLLLYGG